LVLSNSAVQILSPPWDEWLPGWGQI
jgi:hypothetical protein